MITGNGIKQKEKAGYYPASPMTPRRENNLETRIEELEKKVRFLADAIYDLKMCGDVSPKVFNEIVEDMDQDAMFEV
jgi:hypothetical protein